MPFNPVKCGTSNVQPHVTPEDIAPLPKVSLGVLLQTGETNRKRRCQKTEILTFPFKKAVREKQMGNLAAKE